MQLTYGIINYWVLKLQCKTKLSRFCSRFYDEAIKSSGVTIFYNQNNNYVSWRLWWLSYENRKCRNGAFKKLVKNHIINRHCFFRDINLKVNKRNRFQSNNFFSALPYVTNIEIVRLYSRSRLRPNQKNIKTATIIFSLLPNESSWIWIYFTVTIPP